MLFRQLFDRESCTYTYLIASDLGREAVIIDPVLGQLNQYIRLINQLDLRLVFAIDTHMHADHITATGDLRLELDSLVMMGEQTSAAYVTRKFGDEEHLDFDGIALKAIYTPGHTNDSYCLLLGDRILTGDTLLIRGTGRTDFQGGDAGKQFDSLFQRILTLPNEILVYPGHDYNGMTVSSIGEEKKFNPRLQLKSREEYIELMNNLNLVPPRMIERAIPANLKCGLTRVC